MAGETLHEKYVEQGEKLKQMQQNFEEREKNLLAKIQEISKSKSPPSSNTIFRPFSNATVPPRPENQSLVVPPTMSVTKPETLPKLQPSRSAELTKLYPTISQVEMSSNIDKSFIRGPPAPPPSRGEKAFEYDMWEAINNTKLVVAFDAPGVDLGSMEIVIIGFTVRITRKLGEFEEKHLANGYKPTRRARYSLDSAIITDELKLPYLVRPDTKKAFHHHGTVYLTLEKLEVSMFTVSARDWQEEPSF